MNRNCAIYIQKETSNRFKLDCIVVDYCSSIYNTKGMYFVGHDNDGIYNDMQFLNNRCLRDHPDFFIAGKFFCSNHSENANKTAHTVIC